METLAGAEQAGERLYVAGEPDRVLVLDLSGNEIAALKVVDPGGMEVVGDTLFVVSVSEGKIHRFDLSATPPTRLPALDVAAAGQPDDIAYGGGRLWLVSTLDCGGDHPLWSVALDGSDLQGYDIGPSVSCRWLYADAHAPDRLALRDPYRGLALVDVSGTTPTELATGLTVCSNASFGPDGDTFLVDRGDPVECSIPSLEEMRRFVGGADACGWIRVGAASGVVVAASWDRIDVWSYADPTSPIGYFPVRVDLWGIRYRGVVGHPLLFSPDGQWLYAFERVDYPEALVRLLLMRPLERATALEVRGFGYIKYGEDRTLRATLIGGSPAAQVQLYVRPHGRDEWRLRETQTVDADGRVSFPVAPRVNTRYRIVYPGEDGWLADSVRGSIRVRVLMYAKLLEAARRAGRWRIYHSDQPVVYVAAVYPPYPKEDVWVGLYRYDEWRGWRLIASVRVLQNRDGRIGVYIPEGTLRVGEYRMRSSFTPQEHDRAEGWPRDRYFRIRP